MFLSREIDIKLSQNYTKSYIYQISYKSCSMKQTIFNNYATNLKTTISHRSSKLSLYPLSFFLYSPFKYCYNVVFLFHCYLVHRIIIFNMLPIFIHPKVSNIFSLIPRKRRNGIKCTGQSRVHLSCYHFTTM